MKERSQEEKGITKHIPVHVYIERYALDALNQSL